jgi:peroxiredoxin
MKRLSRNELFLLTLLLLSVGGNVAQSWRLRCVSVPSGRPDEVVDIGDPVPALELRSASGEVMTLDFSGHGQPTVVYVFSSTCPWCNQNIRSVNELVKGVGDRFRFIGACHGTADLQGYAARHGISFPIYGEPSQEFRQALGLDAVPVTLVVSAEGRLLKRWPGAYFGPVLTDIQEYFGAEIPEAQFPPAGGVELVLCRDKKGVYGQGAVTKHDGRFERCTDGRWLPL